jgi:ankyrin repeat protein
MTRRAVVLAAALCAVACNAPPPPLPSLPPRPALAAGYDPDDRFPIAPRPLCSEDAIAAFEAADPAAITAAAARGVNFSCGDVDTPTLATRAIFANDLDRLERLLTAGADPNARWGGRHADRLPIQTAIECPIFLFECDQGAIVRLLLAHGADPNARWCEFESRGGNDRIPGCTSTGGSTPLVMAAVVDNSDVVYRLLDAGANPWLATGDGHLALDMAKSVPVYQLIASAMFPNAATRSADVRRHWDERIWPNWQTDPRLQTRLTALFSGPWWVAPPPPPPPPPTAAPIETSSGGAQQSSPVVKALRDRLPGVHFTRPNDGPRVGLVRLLLDEGEDANRRLAGRSTWTPLALALSSNDHYSAMALLEAGADPDARVCGVPSNWMREQPTDESGCTLDRGTSPLMLAAAAAAVDTMRALVARGADLDARDWRGRSVADYAPVEARDAIMAAVR